MLRLVTQRLAHWAVLGCALFAASCGNDNNDGMTVPTTSTVSSAVQASGVPVPDYQADTGFVGLQVDAKGAVLLSGQIRLQFGHQGAETYVVSATNPGTTSSSVDAAFLAGMRTTVIGAPVAIPATALQVPSLPAVRYVILAHSATASPAIRSYQVLSFRFVGP